MREWLTSLGGVAVLWALTTAAVSAQTGTINGRVVDGRTMEPLSGAQVFVAGTSLGTLTDVSGAYRLSNVPAGAVTVQVLNLGYRTSQRALTIAPGATISANFQLDAEAISLDQIIVTGTAGGTERRAIGNVVDRLDAAALTELTVATDITQLLGQRSTGVVMLGATGAVGSAPRIRIRGVQSMGLGNDPIVYIDGIRMDSNPNAGPGAGVGGWRGARGNRINDLNPDDIASVEIIKGPAAATLYGTEASNGVIQIITKRGRTGSPRVEVLARTGTRWMMNPAGRQGLTWATDTQGVLHSYNVYEYEREQGLGDIFTYGFLQSYQASLSGGLEGVRYFLSGSWEDETGIRPENTMNKFNLRANLDVDLTDRFTLATSLGYSENGIRDLTGNYRNDPMANMAWASPLPSRVARNRGYFHAPPEEWGKVRVESELNRFTGSIEARYRPRDWFSHRLIAGLDTNAETYLDLTPRQVEGAAHFFGTAGLGTVSLSQVSNRFFTLDYSGSATFDLSESLSSVSSFGFQYYARERHSFGASGTELPAPQLTTVSSAAVRNGSEGFEENLTVGAYVQQQFGWHNRRFITLAVRADDNSAFGAEYDAAIYPKVSGSWVVHEEDFWDIPLVNELRIRAAWGAAGKQPGTFDQAQLLTPEVGHQDKPVLRPFRIGNPKLKPERGEELELGFDAKFLDGRVDLAYTRFQRNTKDAIVFRPLPRSLGWPGTQVVNLGLVKGWGNELALDFRVLQKDRFTWDLGTQFSTFQNRIEDLGPDTDFIGDNYVGYSIADFYHRTVLSAELDANGRVIAGTAMCDGGTGPLGVDRGGPPVPCSQAPRVRWGHSQPTWDFGVNSTFSAGPFTLYARVDALGGHYQLDTTTPANITSNVLTYLSNVRTDPLTEAYKIVGRNPLGTYEAGFARLREVSAQYALPDGIVGRVNASRGSVTLAARNLWILWTAQDGWKTRRDGRLDMKIGDGHIWDPEVRSTAADLPASHVIIMPPTATFNVTVRFSF